MMTILGMTMLVAFLAGCLGGVCYLIGYTHGIEHEDGKNTGNHGR